jgi:hypothetical protein
VLDLDEDEANKILLTLDPLATLAEADGERIKSLLETVQTSDQAVEALLRRTAGDQIWNARHPQIEPPAQIDKAGELQEKWTTRTGQLWVIGGHRLLCGESTKAADVIRLMGGEKAELFQSDPPYATNYTGGSHPQSWGNRGSANRNKGWSDHYHEAKRANIENDEDCGIELYRGFIRTAVTHAITPNAA